MRILLISNLYPNATQPERGIFTAQKLVRLTDRFEFKVIAPIAFFPLVQSPYAPPIGKVSPVEQRDGVEVLHPRAWYLPRIWRRANARLFAASIRPLVQQLRQRFSFDLIWATWGYPDVVAAVTLAQELNLPVLASLHGSDVNYGFQTAWTRHAILRALGECKAVVAPSEIMRQIFVREGLSRDKVFCVYNGVDHDRFHYVDRAQACASTGLDPTRRRILFVGHLVPVKGLPYLLTAFHSLVSRQRNGNLELVLIGNGPQREALEHQARRKGIAAQVKFLGRRGHTELCNYFNASDLFCLPSLNEGLPNVVLEAFACGLPVVASRVGGIPEVITSEELGLMARPEDAASLEQALHGALVRQWDRQRILDHSRQFDWRTTTDFMAELFHYVGGEGAKPITVSIRQPIQAAAEAFRNQSRQLVDLALEGLPRMYRRDRRLFCFKMIERGGKLEPVDVSVRYTAMTLIGLAEANACGFTVPLSLPDLIDGLLPHAEQPLPIGDLGLILWATAKCEPARAETLLPVVQRRWGNEVRTGRHEQLSMYLQWLLCGLCEFVSHHPRHGDAEKLLHAIYGALLEWHYNVETHLFYYQPRQRPEWRRPFMHKACYFAEQVYGIHALDRYARLTGNERAAEFARQTATKLCGHQSPNGGWAWLYDGLTGELIDLYPVYSVHQTGMGPMAMLPLTGPAGDPLTTAIQSGVQWVFSVNELAQPMLDHHHGVIWRSIKARYLPRQRHLLHKGLSAVNLSALSRKKLLQPSSFRVDYECRPYELGWLLYALSGAAKKLA